MTKFDYRVFGSHALDRDKESKRGVWIDVAQAGFLCLRAGGSNKEYMRASQTSYFAAQKAHPTDRVALNEQLNRDALGIFLDTILLDWRGIQESGTGKEVPYSREAAVELFEELPDVLDALMERCRESDRYLKDFVDDAENRLGKN